MKETPAVVLGAVLGYDLQVATDRIRIPWPRCPVAIMLRLRGKVQHYDWGRLGVKSRVGRLYAEASGSSVAEDLPYAELWLGTHESGPSVVASPSPMPVPWPEQNQNQQQQQLLREWLEDHPEALGERVLERWQGELPFLFKVLSIQKALSIQAHPNKKLAEQLHRLQPQIYRDANHKPEMAVALTEFEALCGFVTPRELAHAMAHVPELRLAVGEAAASAVLTAGKDKGDNCEDSSPAAAAAGSEAAAAAAALRAAFSALMEAREGTIKDAVQSLVRRLHQEQQQGRRWTAKEELLVRLDQQFPGDIGVLAAMFLNHVKLGEGEALYLAADEPHAYVSGECVECMATSDNVVRAGLTPKFRDTATLCSMLTYKQGMPEVLPGLRVDAFTRRYQPPFDEFEVDSIALPPASSTTLHPLPGPSIFLVLSGAGCVSSSSSSLHLNKSDAIFVPAGLELRLAAASTPLLHIFRAGVSSRVFDDVNKRPAEREHATNGTT